MHPDTRNKGKTLIPLDIELERTLRNRRMHHKQLHQVIGEHRTPKQITVAAAATQMQVE